MNHVLVHYVLIKSLEKSTADNSALRRITIWNAAVRWRE